MFKRIILFLLVFCLPFQLGLHFWLPQSFVSSFRIDYLSPTIYLTDLLILCYLIINFRRLKLNFLFSLLITINLLASSGNPITIFAWLKILEYYFLFQVLRTETNLISKVKQPFLISLCLILTLATLQFIRQSSLGGLFYYLGERPLSVAAVNIAKIGNFLRPYSTFSHPNSLAGYLLVVLVLLPIFTPSKFLRILTSAVILLTFSKAAIFALILITFLQLTFLQSLTLSLLLGLTPLITYIINLPAWLQLSFTSRHFLFLPSLQIIKDHWLFGVGLRQFIPSLATLLPGNQLSYLTLQPVHNIFLLIVAELGVLPILILGIFLFKSKITLNPKYCSLATIILITGVLDHYWWTLPQNQLIIVLTLALLTNMSYQSHTTNKSY